MLKKISILTIIALTTNFAQASKKPRHEKPALEKDREKKRHKAAMVAWQAARQVQAATSIAASPAANADKPASSVAATVAAETAVVQKQTSDRDTAVNAPEITIPQEVPLRMALDPVIKVTALQNIILGYVDNWLVVKTLTGHSDEVYSISWGPDSKQLDSASFDKKTKKLWDVASGKVIQTVRADNQETPLIAGQKSYCFGGNCILIYDPATSEPGIVLTTQNYYNQFTSAAPSPDGKQLASGSSDGAIKIWELATAKEIKTLKERVDKSVDFCVWLRDGIICIAWSPNGKYIASSSHDCSVTLWDTETGKEVKILTGHRSAVVSIALSPNGKYIASGSSDGTIIIWRKY